MDAIANRWAEVYRDLRDKLEDVAGRNTDTDLTVDPSEVRMARRLLEEHDEWREATKEES